MHDTRETLLLLGRFLSPDDSAEGIAGLRRAIAAEEPDWMRLIAVANEHLVAPALWASVRRKRCQDLLPSDVRSYLAELYRRNRWRNGLIRRQACEAVAALNYGGVVPAVLKGGIYLFEEDCDAGIRMMADIDLLVRHADAARSRDVLKGLGYVILDGDGDRPVHATTLFRPGAITTIDLHYDLGPQTSVLDADTAWRAVMPLRVDGVRLMALSPTQRVLHNILNTEVIGPNYRAGAIALRQLYDIALLCRREGGDIDWGAIDLAMAKPGLRHVPAASRYGARRLFGLSLRPQRKETLRARLHLWRCLLQLRSAPLMSAGRFWAGATHPLNRVRMDYLYACGQSTLRLNGSRLYHLWTVVRRYREGVIVKAVGSAQVR